MSTRDKIILALWLIVAIGSPIWMYFQIRRQDKKDDKLDADWDEWIANMAEKNQKGKVFDLPRGQEKDFQARTRRAESLGFTDDNPKKAS